MIKKDYQQKEKIYVLPDFLKFLDFPGYVKLNYNGIIGRIDRSLTDKHVYSSVEMTSFLKRAFRKGIYHKLSFFPEPGARLYKNAKIVLILEWYTEKRKHLVIKLMR